ncbi:MAG: 30S ribosomal protein S20 [Negativicutes bacterium]|nr:30S ribosomal protein S20 [Negativicutes bacterium]
MPNKLSSVKSVRLDEKRRVRNHAIKSGVRTAIRKAREAVAEQSDSTGKQLAIAASKIDKAAAKGVLHRNAAARKKSRLAKLFNKSQQVLE